MSSRSMFPIPFTSSQWRELENQALIFKYMVSGIPIPHHLLFTIKTTTPFTSKLFPQPVGWNNFLQMSLGRKIDTEPGRCRRTDGKKWRCSKEAYPDSKYCERHMHRGKNRSRKPVDVFKTTNLTNNRFSNPVFSTPNHNETNTLLHLQSSSYSNTNQDCRYTYGLKEEVDEHVFFSQEPSRNNERAESLQMTPLTMSCSSSLYQKQNCSSLQSDQCCYNKLHQSLTDTLEQQKRDESQKTVYRFFDELPLKERGSWLDLEDKWSTTYSVSATELSISIPNTSSSDLFPIFSSKNPARNS